MRHADHVIEEIIAHAGGELTEHILRCAGRRLAWLMSHGYTLDHERTAVEAHRLWQLSGRPEGRDWEFWFAAEKSIEHHHC